MKLPPNRKCINCNSSVSFLFLLYFCSDVFLGFWCSNSGKILSLLLICNFSFQFNDVFFFSLHNLCSGSTVRVYEFLDIRLHSLQRDTVSISHFHVIFGDILAGKLIAYHNRESLKMFIS